MSSRSWVVLVLLPVMLLGLAGCGSFGGSNSALATRTVPTDPPSTTQLTPQPTATVAIASPTTQSSAHNCTPTSSGLTIGDLSVSKPTVLYGFNADFMLPDSVATARPLTVTLQNNEAVILGNALQSGIVVQPVAFVVGVCNTSATTTHHLSRLGVTLQSLTPYSGRLNAMNGCALLYARAGSMGGECASGYSPDLELSFQMPGTAAAQATVTEAPPQPADLAPGKGIDVSFDIQPSSSPAYATYRLGVGIDGQAVTYPTALTTQATINAPIAYRWAGGNCSTAAMQSQIPATSPANTYYVCAKSS